MNEQNNFYYKKDETTPPVTQAQPVKEKLIYTAHDLLLSAMIFLCSFFYINNLFLGGFEGFGVTIFTFIFCTSAIIFFKLKNIKSNKTSNIILGYIILLAMNFSLFENTGLSGTGFLILTGVTVYWIFTYGKLTEIADELFFKKVFSAFLIAPFTNFFAPIATLSVIPKKAKSKNYLYILVGILISLPILFMAGDLLSNSSDAFAGFVNIIRVDFDFNLDDFLFKIFLTLPVWGYLFSLIYTSSLDTMKEVKTKEKTLPKMVFNTALIVIVAFYFLYFFIEITDVIFKFSLKSPNYEYSSMAVESFSTICQIAILNFLVFLTFKNFVELKNNNFSKILLSIIGGQTIAFIGLALANLIRYIAELGLTYKRVNSFWFLIAMAVTVVCFSIGLWIRFNYTKVSVIFVAVSFLILFYSNEGALIAKYNMKYCDDLTKYSYSKFDVEGVPTLLEHASANNNDKDMLIAVGYIFDEHCYKRENYPLRNNIQYIMTENKAKSYSSWEFACLD